MLDPVAARTLLFTVLVPGTVTVVLPFAFLRSGIDPLPLSPLPWGIGRLSGAFAIAAGIWLYARSGLEFVRAGRGTPAPFDPPRHLVVTGPFARLRNPIYVAILLLLVGEGLLFGSGGLLAYSLLLALGFHLRVTRFEEPGLEERFGQAWHEYRAKVPRWVPRL